MASNRFCVRWGAGGFRYSFIAINTNLDSTAEKMEHGEVGRREEF